MSGQGNFSDMEILENHARVGGGIFIDPSTTKVSTSVVLSNVVILDNEADEQGGGIMVPGLGTGAGASLTLLFTSVSRNKVIIGESDATRKGGGLYFGRGTLTLGGVTFNNNKAVIGPEAYRVTPGTRVVYIPLLPNDYEEVTGN